MKNTGNGAAVAEKDDAAVEANPFGDSQPVHTVAKTAEESALESAHAELIATARICAKFQGRMTKLNALSMGESAMEALGNYYKAYAAFEKSCA